MFKTNAIRTILGVIDLKFAKMGDTAPAGPQILRKGASHEFRQYSVRPGYELSTNAPIPAVC
jgi:hypothetical protein